MVTRTHTYAVIKYANPHLYCDECGNSVSGFRDDNHHNYPCNHAGATESNCPSWSPVDGCTCKENH